MRDRQTRVDAPHLSAQCRQRRPKFSDVSDVLEGERWISPLSPRGPSGSWAGREVPSGATGSSRGISPTRGMVFEQLLRSAGGTGDYRLRGSAASTDWSWKGTVAGGWRWRSIHQKIAGELGRSRARVASRLRDGAVQRRRAKSALQGVGPDPAAPGRCVRDKNRAQIRYQVEGRRIRVWHAELGNDKEVPVSISGDALEESIRRCPLDQVKDVGDFSILPTSTEC